jgi:hypothetical protein
MSEVKYDLVVATIQGDEVQRYLCWNPDKPAFNYEIGTEVVLLSDLERVSKISDNYYAICVEREQELAALREELTQLRRWEQMIRENSPLVQRLTAAEQRNAESRQLLHDWKCLYEDMRWGDATTFAKTEEFLSTQPTESGASE